MSRNYIVHYEFQNNCVKKLKEVIKNIGLYNQVLYVKYEYGNTYMWLQLCAKGGEEFQDVLENVSNRIYEEMQIDFEVDAWDLHPDNAYTYSSEELLKQ